MNSYQSEFITALLDPDKAVPAGLSDPQGRPAGSRFSVYRNNVAVSLTEALKTAFPVICKLVGDEFFQAMAGVYLRAHPPKSPLLMFYGVDMPEFLTGFEPVANLGYLPDIARLEFALRQSYHAADTQAIAPKVLQAMPTDQLMGATLQLAPSARLLQSQWPIHALWLANTRNDAPKVQMAAQDVLVVRREFDPEPMLLGTGAGAFIEALGKGRTFGEAIKTAGTGFDLTAALGILLGGGVITKISKGTVT
ncbi:MAG: putative DNA-binding domain-containing protein [Marinosulfonomonas sp.]|nr:putative DNA-binding domain-containing protein [Marinosulfonomonas sp.]